MLAGNGHGRTAVGGLERGERREDAGIHDHLAVARPGQRIVDDDAGPFYVHGVGQGGDGVGIGLGQEIADGKRIVGVVLPGRLHHFELGR